MVNNVCPLCLKMYYDKKINAMNLDEPEYRGYCYRCRLGIKKMGFDNFCKELDVKEDGGEHDKR